MRTPGVRPWIVHSITGAALPGRDSALQRAVVWSACLAVGSLYALSWQPAEPQRLLPILVSFAAVCLAQLSVRRAPSVAWLAAIGAAYSASTAWFAVALSLAPGLQLSTWLLAVAWASAYAIWTVMIAVRYATRPATRIEPIAVPVSLAILGWLVVGCLTTIVVVVAGQRTPDPAFNLIDIAIVPISFYLPLLLGVTALGVVADIRAARDRAADRFVISPESGRARQLWDLASETLRELVPGQSASREATQAAERTRLAGDLHASVLPGLRRAIADAEAGGDPEALARQLRSVDLELERLMADRWPVVLEAFGLVGALEDLAERIEGDTGRSIQIDIERAGDRPPAAIERTAWRVAQVALDNATRHAAASDISVRIAVDPERVMLAISDDGPGFDPKAPGAVRVGARGLADANRRALAVGATVRIESRTGDGTTVAFEWVARRA